MPEETVHTFYTSYPPAWKAMIEACEGARRTIDCEQYIFEEDEIGNLFASVFIRKAAEGVRVRVLLDAIGSDGLLKSALIKKLQAAGVLVIFYNHLRIRPFRIMANFLRTHRKILVVDDEIAFTGGMGISSRMKDWRDTAVRVTGAPAKMIGRSFQTMWSNAREHRHRRFEKPDEMALYTVYTNGPHFLGRYFYQALLKKIRGAKKSIYLSSPYFVPTLRLRHALRKAAKRGVDVRIVLPLASDTHTVDLAAHFYFADMLKAGVKIYRYSKSFFHAKPVIIDGAWAAVGSANLDNLSFIFNHELNVASVDPAFVGELTRDFEADVAQSKKLELVEWLKRPFWEKVKEFIVSAIHPIL